MPQSLQPEAIAAVSEFRVRPPALTPTPSDTERLCPHWISHSQPFLSWLFSPGVPEAGSLCRQQRSGATALGHAEGSSDNCPSQRPKVKGEILRKCSLLKISCLVYADMHVCIHMCISAATHIPPHMHTQGYAHVCLFILGDILNILCVSLSLMDSFFPWHTCSLK